jgi:tetratricopeptide repeat protein 30
MSSRPQLGSFTKTVYTWIRDGKYKQAISFLLEKQIVNPNSRAALSLLGYCYYHDQDFSSAANTYEQLVQLFPAIDDYKINYALSLYQACSYEEATRIAFDLEESSSSVPKTELLKLQAAIKFAEDDIPSSRGFLEQIPDDDISSSTSIDKQVNMACLLVKENDGERIEDALTAFSSASEMDPGKPDLWYNIALCHYKLKDYTSSIKVLSDIISKGIRDHPELAVGLSTDGIDVKSVGNTLALHETSLVEAFNLKAAIEFLSGNNQAASEALTDMPPRQEHELDPVTLHNQALIRFEDHPSESFEKLAFLIQQQSSFPPETFANLLILYCKYEYYDLAADVMAENAHLTFKLLTPYLYDFLDALITQQTSPEEAYRKFDEMGNRFTDQMRKLMKQIQESRRDDDGSPLPSSTPSMAVIASLAMQDANIRKLSHELHETLALYIPVLMSQAKIYWDLEMYSSAEKVFRKSVEFCSDDYTWKLNVAHVLFMQENKFKEATGFYEPLVKKSYENILDVSAIVLANLCVSYIMTGQNEDAEELMSKIEKEEEKLAYNDPDRKTFHLCIVNLVIGTLYCVKGNYEFGISRVIKSLEPYKKKLGTDTWFYAKRCFLSLLENMSKQIITLKDSIQEDCLQFLTQCEEHGYEVKAIAEAPLEMESLHPGRNTVSYEARLIKALFLQVIQNKIY